MRSVRELPRVARSIQNAYEKRRHHHDRDGQAGWERLERCIDETLHLRRLFETAQTHGWQLAAREKHLHLVASLRACAEVANRMRSEWLVPSQPIPSLGDLLAELQQLDAEFDDVLIDARNKTIAVQTGPIVLEEIPLGPFLVRLNWSRFAERCGFGCLEIVPLEPNPAGTDDTVPHPHVRSSRLCAGDATLPLQNALEQGRLADAFHLVRAVLENYNPDSAYVSLADWGGVSCWNCNSTTTDDDRSFCEGCDRDMCYDCISSCKHCDRTRCSSCMSRCDVCDEGCCRLCLTASACSDLSLCKDCLRVCQGCGAEVAPAELDEDTKCCPACQEAAVDSDTKTDELVPVTPTKTT